MRDIRCRAIECMACFGEAVGGGTGGKFAQHAVDLMKGTISYFDGCCGDADTIVASLSNMEDKADDAFVKTNI